MDELIKQLEEYYDRLDKAATVARDLADRLEAEANNVSEALDALGMLRTTPIQVQEIEVPLGFDFNQPLPEQKYELTFNLTEMDRKALELAFGGKL